MTEWGLPETKHVWWVACGYLVILLTLVILAGVL